MKYFVVSAALIITVGWLTIYAYRRGKGISTGDAMAAFLLGLNWLVTELQYLPHRSN